MHWRRVRLEPPHLYYRDSERLTTWTEAGLEQIQKTQKDETVWYEPGIDFIVVESFPEEDVVEAHEYYAFPHIEAGTHSLAFQSFRST